MCECNRSEGVVCGYHMREAEELAMEVNATIDPASPYDWANASLPGDFL